jgi:hypothetical protein
MPDQDVQSQGTNETNTVESNTTGTAITPRPDEAAVDSRVATCERLLNEAVEKDLPATTFADFLKQLGLKAIEAIDYIEEYNQRLEIRRSKAKQHNPATVSSEPPQATGAAVHAQEQEERDRAVEEAAWASFQSSLESASAAPPSGLSPSIFDRMLEIFGQETSTPSLLSKSVLAIAPHLADNDDSVFKDPYSEVQDCLHQPKAFRKPYH